MSLDAHASSTDDKLVYMANQIARYFATQPRGDAAEAIAEHIKLFWEPRMRRSALALIESGGVGFDPLARAALERLK
jgi:formate dehydrogenase subunit delta